MKDHDIVVPGKTCYTYHGEVVQESNFYVCTCRDYQSLIPDILLTCRANKMHLISEIQSTFVNIRIVEKDCDFSSIVVDRQYRKGTSRSCFQSIHFSFIWF